MSDNTKGVLWVLLAGDLFFAVAAMAKIAVNEFPILQILFFRQIVVLLSSLPSIARSFPNSLLTQNPGLHALRLLGAFVALSCSIWAVSVLPLTTAITLMECILSECTRLSKTKYPVSSRRYCA